MTCCVTVAGIRPARAERLGERPRPRARGLGPHGLGFLRGEHAARAISSVCIRVIGSCAALVGELLGRAVLRSACPRAECE